MGRTSNHFLFLHGSTEGLWQRCAPWGQLPAFCGRRRGCTGQTRVSVPSCEILAGGSAGACGAGGTREGG